MDKILITVKTRFVDIIGWNMEDIVDLFVSIQNEYPDNILTFICDDHREGDNHFPHMWFKIQREETDEEFLLRTADERTKLIYNLNAEIDRLSTKVNNMKQRLREEQAKMTQMELL